MKVPAETPKKEISTNEVNNDSIKTTKDAKKAEVENYFSPQDTVEISEKAQKLNSKSNTKIVTLPAETENFVAYISKATQKNKIKQIASLMMNGKKISAADERLLKQADPQLYAQIKAKFKSEKK